MRAFLRPAPILYPRRRRRFRLQQLFTNTWRVSQHAANSNAAYAIHDARPTDGALSCPSWRLHTRRAEQYPLVSPADRCNERRVVQPSTFASKVYPKSGETDNIRLSKIRHMACDVFYVGSGCCRIRDDLCPRRQTDSEVRDRGHVDG